MAPPELLSHRVSGPRLAPAHWDLRRQPSKLLQRGEGLRGRTECAGDKAQK